MNKTELVAAIAEASGLNKTAAEATLNNMLSIISGALAKGDSVSLVGFGTFSVTARAAREGRNPQTGATIKIAARKAVKFKAGKKLSDGLN